MQAFLFSISMAHRRSFFNTDPVGYNNTIPPRFIGFINGSFKTSDMVIINPMAYYTIQADAHETGCWIKCSIQFVRRW